MIAIHLFYINFGIRAFDFNPLQILHLTSPKTLASIQTLDLLKKIQNPSSSQP